MISDATDYQYIQPVGLINGGILPARDVAAHGSSITVRAEDIDFALEAAYERSNIYRDQPPSLPSPTVVIKAPRLSPIANAWSVIQSSLYRDTFPLPYEGETTAWTPVACISPTATFPDIGPVEYNYNPGIASGNNPAFSELYPNRRIFSGFYQADYDKLVLNHDYLRHFYYSLQRAERLWLAGYDSAVCKSLGTTSGTDSLEHQYTNTYAGTNGFGSVTAPAGIRYRLVSENVHQRYTYGVTSASMKCLPNMSSRVASAKAIALYQARLYYGTLPNKYYYYTKVHDCQINGGIEIPSAAFTTNPLTVANKLGVEFPETYSDSGSMPYERLDVGIIEWYFVAWYNFRTEIRSLNWQWTP